jgi:hypothetical protein
MPITLGRSRTRKYTRSAKIRPDGDHVKAGSDIDTGCSIVNDRKSRSAVPLLCFDMLISQKLNTPDGDSHQITFLNGVT